MALTTFPRFGSRRPKTTTDVFDILGDLVPFLEAVDAAAAKLGQTGARNKIDNGDFRINQRGYASGATIPLGSYGFDRWKSTASGANAVLAYTADAYQRSILINLNAGARLAQYLELTNVPPGRYVLSHAGNAYGRVYYEGASPPAFAACPLVVDLAATNADSVIVEFEAQGGSAKSIDRVQLEQIDATGVAADATPFERRPLGEELRRCQRVYQRIRAGSSGSVFGTGVVNSGTTAIIAVPLAGPMRVAPTITHLFTTLYDGTTGPAVTALAHFATTPTPNTHILSLTVTAAAGGLTTGRAALLYQSGTSAAELALSAEM